MNYFKKEIIPLAIYIVIIVFLSFISEVLDVGVTEMIAPTALYLSLSNLVNKENR